MYESPRWLVQHGRLDEAGKILEKIQARDGEDPDRRKEIAKLLEVEYQVFTLFIDLYRDNLQSVYICL